MRVRIYDVDQHGNQTPSGECELVEAFGDGRADPDFLPAADELARAGRYWLGGGAAPLVLLMAVR
jgi:hypothetical protein